MHCRLIDFKGQNVFKIYPKKADFVLEKIELWTIIINKQENNVSLFDVRLYRSVTLFWFEGYSFISFQQRFNYNDEVFFSSYLSIMLLATLNPLIAYFLAVGLHNILGFGLLLNLALFFRLLAYFRIFSSLLCQSAWFPPHLRNVWLATGFFLLMAI